MIPARSPLGALQFHLFARPLHPELFEPRACRVVEFDGARVDARILPDGHWISWQRGKGWASQVASDAGGVVLIQRVDHAGDRDGRYPASLKDLQVEGVMGSNARGGRGSLV